MKSGLDSPRAPTALSEPMKWGLLIGVTLALLAALLLAAEIGIRVRQYLKYGAQKPVEQVYETDRRLNLRVARASIDSGRIRTNSLGFRGPEIPREKPSGVVRIAFLGASTTWCAEVSSNAAVWPEIVTATLSREMTGRKFDFVNGGVPGYVLRSSATNLEHRIAPLSPDVIVIYHATNDLSGELRSIAASRGLIAEAKVAEQFWPSKYSLLWDLSEKNIRIALAQRRAESGMGLLAVDSSTIGSSFQADLTKLVRAAKETASVVAIATFSTQLRPGQSSEQKIRAAASSLYYVPFMTPDGLIAAFARYNQIIREVASAEKVVLIDGEGGIPGDGAHFVDTVHFTDAGSRAMAHRVVTQLRPAIERVFR